MNCPQCSTQIAHPGHCSSCMNKIVLQHIENNFSPKVIEYHNLVAELHHLLGELHKLNQKIGHKLEQISNLSPEDEMETD